MPDIGRLKKRPDFLKAAAARVKWVTPGLILQARRRPITGDTPDEPAQADLVRVGFTVSRKVGKAVQRNRARRRLRSAASEVLPVLGRPGYDYVLIGRGGTLDRPYSELVGDLRTALERLTQEGDRNGRPKEPAKRSKQDA